MRRDQLPIREPCHAEWDAMTGDAVRRFCGSCTRHVHDLSAMTATAASRLLATESNPPTCTTMRRDEALPGDLLQPLEQRLVEVCWAVCMGDRVEVREGGLEPGLEDPPLPGWARRGERILPVTCRSAAVAGGYERR